MAHLSDEALTKLTRGGHDPLKVYAAYKVAVEHKGSPTVILAQTIKGYGLGEAGEGQNTAHNKKKMEEASIAKFRTRFGISLPAEDEDAYAPFYKPADDSPEIKYIHERAPRAGRLYPARVEKCPPLKAPADAVIEPFLKGSGGRAVSTTMAFADLLRHLLKDPELGKYIVPIIPDEARTFGMEDLFSKVGIYSSVGQLYEPVDFHTLTRYREDKTGQILEEGITEAGSMSSFIAAGTAYANLGVPMVPFFIYYSMFGFQRVGDLIWAAADMRCRGFLIGGTAGRTTLAGEGLQHQDGHSHILASTVPTIIAYRSGLRLRDRPHRAGRHPPHVRKGRAHFLLPHDRQRELSDGADAGRSGRRRRARHVQVSGLAGTSRQGRQIEDSLARQRLDPARGAARPGIAGGEVRRRRRCLERHQLQGIAARGAGMRALEPAAPDRAGAKKLRGNLAGRRKGDLHRGQRLHEGERRR